VGCGVVVQEPVGFFGGLFAGVLRLDVEDEPLKDWIERTAETAGVSAAPCGCTR
jgi:hypothetical protein